MVVEDMVRGLLRRAIGFRGSFLIMCLVEDMCCVATLCICGLGLRRCEYQFRRRDWSVDWLRTLRGAGTKSGCYQTWRGEPIRNLTALTDVCHAAE